MLIVFRNGGTAVLLLAAADICICTYFGRAIGGLAICGELILIIILLRKRIARTVGRLLGIPEKPKKRRRRRPPASRPRSGHKNAGTGTAKKHPARKKSTNRR